MAPLSPPLSPPLNPSNTSTLPSQALSQLNGATTVNPTSDAAILGRALDLLGGIQHIPAEESYLRTLGLSPCFHNGKEALDMIKNNHIQVVFEDMGDSLAHAQWDAEQSKIMVNAKYRGDNSPTTLYAISEALYHEAGHAANVVTDPRTGQHYNLSLGGVGLKPLGDGESSIQEELDCMALNSLAHGHHEATDPAYAQASSSSRLLRDGVQLYYRYLLKDPDPYKNAIINRIALKYPDLPLASPGHEPPRPMLPYAPLPLAYRIALKAQNPLLFATQSQLCQPFPPPPGNRQAIWNA